MSGRSARPLLLTVALALAACAGGAARRDDPGPSAAARNAPTPAPPALPAIAPATLGEFAATQRLSVVLVRQPPGAARPPPTVIDAVIAVDSTELHLALLVAGRRVLDIRWDGHALSEERSAEVPAAVSAERIVRDVLVAYAPLAGLEAAVPVGDRVEDRVGSDGVRERRWSSRGRVDLTVRYHADPAWAGALELDNAVEGYRLAIESRPLPVESH